MATSSSLHDSKWAPSTSSNTYRNGLGNHGPSLRTVVHTSNGGSPTGSTQQSQLTKAQKELLFRRAHELKFYKLTRRLKWKSQLLSYSHYRVLNEKQYNVVNGQLFPMEEHEAETMFKADFFEYYVLLERVLVHLLGMVGTTITAAHRSDIQPEADGKRSSRSTADQPPAANEPELLRDKLMAQSRLGDSYAVKGRGHSYHANVLAALEYEGNVLHQVLGTGPVRDFLGMAKELRNRWKDADEKEANRDDDKLVGSRYEQLLKEKNLEDVLCSILGAVDMAAPIAQYHLHDFKSTVDGSRALDKAMTGLDDDDASAPMELMYDIMDCT